MLKPPSVKQLTMQLPLLLDLTRDSIPPMGLSSLSLDQPDWDLQTKLIPVSAQASEKPPPLLVENLSTSLILPWSPKPPMMTKSNSEMGAKHGSSLARRTFVSSSGSIGASHLSPLTRSNHSIDDNLFWLLSRPPKKYAFEPSVQLAWLDRATCIEPFLCHLLISSPTILKAKISIVVWCWYPPETIKSSDSMMDMV